MVGKDANCPAHLSRVPISATQNIPHGSAHMSHSCDLTTLSPLSVSHFSVFQGPGLMVLVCVPSLFTCMLFILQLLVSMPPSTTALNPEFQGVTPLYSRWHFGHLLLPSTSYTSLSLCHQGRHLRIRSSCCF